MNQDMSLEMSAQEFELDVAAIEDKVKKQADLNKK